MIAKTTRLFALLGEDLAADRTYQLYNYIFEINGMDASFVNISVPTSKLRFTLENIHNCEIESYVVAANIADSSELRTFFDTDDFVQRIDAKEGKLSFAASKVQRDESEEAILEALRLNFFEWFGFFPALPDDALKTLKESAPRDSILTRG